MNLFERLVKAYDENLNHSGINGRRLANRLYELSKIGGTSEGGVNRVGFSKEEREAKELVIKWMIEAGLEVSEDGAGNIYGKLEGTHPDLAKVMSGSHVDSVPNGGHFDGPLGVLSALEVVEAWRKENYKPLRPFEMVIFSDEEGARFGSGITGSRAAMGEIDPNKQRSHKDQEGRSFKEVIHQVGLNEDDFFKAKMKQENIYAFVEVHIEQGKRLEQANLSVGAVNGIAGPSWLQITFTGEAGHAGNTPMIGRLDPLVAASEFISGVPKLPKKVSDTSVATVGSIHVSPNGINVIPGEVTLYVDIRDIHEESRDQLVDYVIQWAEQVANQHKLEIEIVEKVRIKPVPIQDAMVEKAIQSIQAIGLKDMTLPSGAGHDAMIIGQHIPVAMLFIRSKNGISHNPKEWSSLNDCVEGVHVLKSMIERLVEEN